MGRKGSQEQQLLNRAFPDSLGLHRTPALLPPLGSCLCPAPTRRAWHSVTIASTHPTPSRVLAAGPSSCISGRFTQLWRKRGIIVPVCPWPRSFRGMEPGAEPRLSASKVPAGNFLFRRKEGTRGLMPSPDCVPSRPLAGWLLLRGAGGD